MGRLGFGHRERAPVHLGRIDRRATTLGVETAP